MCCGDFIFCLFSFTGYNTAFKIGVFTYVNVKAFFTCVDTALVSYAFVFAVNVALAGTTKDTDFISTIFISTGHCTYSKASRRVLFLRARNSWHPSCFQYKGLHPTLPITFFTTQLTTPLLVSLQLVKSRFLSAFTVLSL